MRQKATEEEKRLVVEYVISFADDLVPTRSLFRALKRDEGMDHDLIVAALNELEIENRVWSLYIPEENDHDLPAGEFFYRPEQEASSRF